MVKSSKPSAKIPHDRRAKTKDRRNHADRRTTDAPIAVERRAKVNRRRQIDPTTCERDYSGEEIEFMHALDQYKRTSGRMFPTCSEILEVIRGLGYQRRAAIDSIEPRSEEPASASASSPCRRSFSIDNQRAKPRRSAGTLARTRQRGSWSSAFRRRRGTLKRIFQRRSSLAKSLSENRLDLPAGVAPLAASSSLDRLPASG